jgi:hypothetical protein
MMIIASYVSKAKSAEVVPTLCPAMLLPFFLDLSEQIPNPS